MKPLINIPGGWGVAALFTMSLPAMVVAQTTIGTSEPTSGATSTAETVAEQLREYAETEQGNSILSPPPAPRSDTGSSLLTWGRIEARVSLDYRLLTGNNILRRRGEKRDITVHDFSPGLTLALGDRWTLSYSPGLKMYSDDSFRDIVSQSASLRGKFLLGGWAVGLTQRYSHTTGPLIETAEETERSTYSTSLSANQALGDRTSLSLTVDQKFNEAQEFSSSRQWSTLNFLNYALSPNVSTGVGLGFGYSAVQFGSDMTYEQAHGRLSWHSGTGKTFANLSAGGEARQFLDLDVPTLISPLFSVSIGYAPVESTTVSASISRSIRPSLLRDQISETTGLQLGLQQRFLGKLYLDLNPGYRITEYKATASGFTVNRRDENFFFSTRLSTVFMKKGRIAVFHQLNENSTGASGFGFSSHQMGLELGYYF